MKKIIALILALTCVLALASCKKTEGFKDISKALEASNPKGADIDVVLETSLGELCGSYDVTYKADNSASIAYSYEQFNKLGEGNGEAKTVVTGEATVSADGKLSEAIGGVAADAAVSFTIKLTEKKLEDVKVEANVLTAKVLAKNTEAVLGVSIDADVELTVMTNGSACTAVVIAYTSEAGPVEISATYNY